jgi:hypothetical protein
MKRKITFMFVLSTAIFTSCLKDPEPLALEALPDVFIQRKVQEGEEKYALAFWVLGNKELESVVVDGPDEQTWELEKDNATNRIFSFFPSESDYSVNKPPTGNYKFSITSIQTNEAPIMLTDKLEDKELGAMVIDSVIFTNSKLKTSWQTLANADAYHLRMYDDTGKLIYVSPKMTKSKKDHSFGVTDQGWKIQGTKAENGKTYQIELLAILYESTSTSNNEDYNVQFISIASTEIVWGE